MKIEYLGLSCFRLSSGGFSLVLDPFSGVRGYPDTATEANLVLCSHGHGDHSYRAGVKLLSSIESPFDIEEAPSYHDALHGVLRGKNTIHILKAEGLRVVHLGDLGHLPDKELVAKLCKCDILMIPVGGHFTIDAAQAKELCELVSPRAIIPMHYKSGSKGHAVIGELSTFTKLFPADSVHYLNKNFADSSELSGICVFEY